MKAVAAAYQARSLQAFQDTLAAHRPQLVDDAFVNAHLTVRQRLARWHRRRVSHTGGLTVYPLPATSPAEQRWGASGQLYVNTPLCSASGGGSSCQ